MLDNERERDSIIEKAHGGRGQEPIWEIPVKTVDTHRVRLMRKLDIHDQTTLVKFAWDRGIGRKIGDDD